MTSILLRWPRIGVNLPCTKRCISAHQENLHWQVYATSRLFGRRDRCHHTNPALFFVVFLFLMCLSTGKQRRVETHKQSTMKPTLISLSLTSLVLAAAAAAARWTVLVSSKILLPGELSQPSLNTAT
ncbi:hypothetical protein B0T13DRAFT_480498 [Neurospora crassa]|nr:hypothetical protein B0T13DRAFT_480498 [Neurospora crassa]